MLISYRSWDMCLLSEEQLHNRTILHNSQTKSLLIGFLLAEFFNNVKRFNRRDTWTKTIIYAHAVFSTA